MFLLNMRWKTETPWNQCWS